MAISITTSHQPVTNHIKGNLLIISCAGSGNGRRNEAPIMAYFLGLLPDVSIGTL